MNLNLGCGGNILEGWSNHDLDVDLDKLPLPFQDASADQVLLEHVWEHFTSVHALRILYDILRILKPGGKLRLCVPVLDRLPNDHARDIILGHGHLAAYNTQLAKQFLRIAGFTLIHETPWRPTDGHHRVIGHAVDDLETARLEAVKPLHA